MIYYLLEGLFYGLFVRGVAFVGLQITLFEAGGGHFFVDGFDGLAGGVEGEVDDGAVGAREGEGGEDLLAEALGGAEEFVNWLFSKPLDWEESTR